MPRLTDRDGTVCRPDAAVTPCLTRDRRGLAEWTLAAIRWSADMVARLVHPRRGTLAFYRTRHRPLAGPCKGARLPR
jgi:hypothetical protein